QLPVNIEVCSLDQFFMELSVFFKEFQVKQSKKHILFEISNQLPYTKPEILTDKVKLRQIFINLIGNAFKFTIEGTIKAGCRLHNNQLEFFVSDTGIGIPQGKQEFIFERFAQLESTSGHIYGGTGLGLSIVKGLTDLLGGTIWLESQLSKGTTFYFTIPCRIDQNVSADPAEYIKNEMYQFAGKTILLVEDDVFNAEYMTEVLEPTGVSIIHTLYGKEAVNIATNQNIDLILMDIRLPDIDGYIVTQAIRKLKPHSIIIAQTAYAAAEDMEKSIKAGCNDYISKPVKRELLLSILEKYFCVV
ncbi:MAG: response regulator, partial [Bacteroidales bacterium]|nr:response regulator [Bacteroidales bacterium]